MPEYAIWIYECGKEYKKAAELCVIKGQPERAIDNLSNARDFGRAIELAKKNGLAESY